MIIGARFLSRYIISGKAYRSEKIENCVQRLENSKLEQFQRPGIRYLPSTGREIRVIVNPIVVLMT